jgi:hypothetical protein
VRKQAIVVLLALGLLLTACSTSSPTATTEVVATTAAVTTASTAPSASVAPASSAPASSALASATRSGAAPVPTVAATATVNVRATASAPSTRTASPAAAGTPLPVLGAGQPYNDPQGRFSFSIPNNWTQVQAAGAEIAFQSPAPVGTIPATINIVLERLPSATVTLDEYDQAGEANLKQQFPDYKSVSLTKVTIDGKPAYKRVYTATIAGRVLQLQQVYLIERDVAYVISCGAPQESFASNATIFDQISGTFKIGQ